ncbi:MAG: acetate--CoA ligase family protein [Hyphomicrobiaceae bacterium]|nr:acetate--CoA ligase family protein [Hyphomicrobiaceae bacterium]
MNFEEHAAKPLLRAAGIETPRGLIATTPDEAAKAAAEIGPCVVKAQVPTGKRGKAGGIKLAKTPDEARAHATQILGMTIGEHVVEKLLVEAQVPIACEMYAAILNDAEAKSPLLLFSAKGGMDIEEIAATHPGALVRLPLDVRAPFPVDALKKILPSQVSVISGRLIELLEQLYAVYRDHDAELVEINPLVLTQDGTLVALDCKFVMDDNGLPRHAELVKTGTPDKTTELEDRAKELHLKFIELEGEVGVLANGAGLTMTTMDAVRHYGGRPANFLEIGGDSYTKATPALALVLANPNVKSLLVNFCGAFARTDVMTEGVINAWLELKPKIPIYFTIHGTGEQEAIAMVRSRLGIEPYDLMDDAVKAAVEAAQ